MIRVLIVEDSAVQREFLVALLEEDGGFSIVGWAHDGLEGVAMAAELKPDLVLMDYHMPHLNGAEATRQIMERTPVPIVITSASLMVDDVAPAFEAVRSGALAVTLKPTDPSHPEHHRLVAELIRTLKLMSEVRVVRRWPRAAPVEAPRIRPAVLPLVPDLVAIGGSTGAPAVISQILTALPSDFAAPILIVQHMARGFCTGFVQWLGSKTTLEVKIAEAGERAAPGCAYVAPDDQHLGIDVHGKLTLNSDELEDGFRPSISALFRSVAAARRQRAIGVILTGMGRDGVAGLLDLKRAGGVTVAQNEQSCVVFGMPREAIRHEAADHVLMPPDIINMIRSMVASKPQTTHV